MQELLIPALFDYNNDMDYRRDEHRVHRIVSHLIWCPKRRKAVLVGNTAQDCRTLMEQTCAERGWEIQELAIQPDHLHLFVRVWPTTSAADVVKECKGLTSHELRQRYPELRQRYPELRKLPSLWTRSYFASTAGNVSAQTIRRYIEAQRGL